MDAERRKILKRKQEEHQTRLHVRDFVSMDIAPFLEVLEVFRRHSVVVELLSLVNVQPERESFLREELKKSPYADYGLYSLPFETENRLINSLLGKYPSQNPFRYVPHLPEHASYSFIDENPLAELALQITVDAGKIYMVYLRYPMIMKVEWHDLLKIPPGELFNIQHDDVVLFPDDMNWLIAYSLEDVWYAGRPGNAGEIGTYV